MTARQRRRRHVAPKRGLRRWYRRQGRLTRVLLVAVIAALAVIGTLIFSREDKEHRAQRASRTTGTKPASSPALPRTASVPRPTAKARREPPAPPRPATPTVPSSPPRVQVAAAPRAAIVIDDLGQRLSHLEQLASLGIPLTIAVIPGLPATAATVREASRLGFEMLLHQPMEPREEGGKNPGASVLLTSMSGDDVRSRLRENLAAVPGAVGVNNHMGSRFTEEPAGLGALMAELKVRGLFWLDSRTTPATRGAELARGAGVPAIERDVFLDAEVDEEFIRGQVRRLLATARERGTAVGIGHPHPETIAMLRKLRGELLDSGVTLVPLSVLVPPAPGTGTALAKAAGRTMHDLPGQNSAAAQP